jgi:hypothetical protein
LLGSGLSSVSFILVFFGHNSLLSLLGQSTTSQELVPPPRVYGFSGPICVPLSLTVYTPDYAKVFGSRSVPFR